MTFRSSAGRVLLGLLLVAFTVAAPLRAQGRAVPSNSGQWVTDAADLLTPSEESLLNTKLRTYQDSPPRKLSS